MPVPTRFALPAFGLMAALAVTPALAEGFSPAQKSEVEKIVREYLLNNPEILIEMSRRLEEKQRVQQQAQAQAGIAAHADALFKSSDDPVIGPADAQITVVEFSDYNCPYCRRSLADVKKLLETNKDVKVIIKEFPILGPGSVEAAKLALAARKQGADKYLAFHEALMTHKGRVDKTVALALAAKAGLDVEKLKKGAADPAIAQAINRNIALAEALGINGTPGFVIGENLIPGAVGYERLNAVVAKVRKEGCKVC
ncbi:MAG TPA: DsbA family protein [Thermopetrobacter sp.]|nr:DsbA family protein [Thermopetrobacter sp.]